MDAKERKVEELTEIQNAYAELRGNPHWEAVKRCFQAMLDHRRALLEDVDPASVDGYMTCEVRVLMAEIRILKNVLGHPRTANQALHAILYPPEPYRHKGGT